MNLCAGHCRWQVILFYGRSKKNTFGKYALAPKIPKRANTPKTSSGVGVITTKTMVYE